MEEVEYTWTQMSTQEFTFNAYPLRLNTIELEDSYLQLGLDLEKKIHFFYDISPSEVRYTKSKVI